MVHPNLQYGVRIYGCVPEKDRVHAVRTLTNIHRAEAIRLEDFVKSRVPGWQVGQPFDLTCASTSFDTGIVLKSDAFIPVIFILSG